MSTVKGPFIRQTLTVSAPRSGIQRMNRLAVLLLSIMWIRIVSDSFLLSLQSSKSVESQSWRSNWFSDKFKLKALQITEAQSFIPMDTGKIR